MAPRSDVKEIGLESVCLRQRVVVELEYPVWFTRDALSGDNPALVDAVAWREPDRRHRAAVIVERAVVEAWPSLLDDLARYASRHGERLVLAGGPLVIEGGEAAKNDGAVPRLVHEHLHALGVDRQSFVLAIGGGALQDAVGYAAATTHRGVRTVRLPTTTLSQGDSGVGVKNGVNAFGKKNFLGTFAPPFAVVNDVRFLETLSPRDRRSGLAEAVKVGLIRDAAFFDWLSAHVVALRDGEPGALLAAVRRSAELHLSHIATGGDPFETGSARPLDFGHWAAHKLEAMTGHELRHGEAVAIGVALDSVYSSASGMLAEPELERILATLDALGFELWHDALARRDAEGRLKVLAGLDEFREHLGGELTLTLLEGIGRGVEVHAVDERRVREAIESLATWRGT